MVSNNIVPTGDVAIAWSIPDLGTHFDDIDEGIAGGTGGDYIQATNPNGDDNDIDHFSFGTLADVDEVTQVEIKVNGLFVNGTHSPEIDLFIDGVWQSTLVGWKETGLTSVRGWHTITYAGLSSNQAQLDALEVRVRADVPDKMEMNVVHTIYCTITYSEVAVGYEHDFIGIPAANIDSIMGIPTANIDNICGL